MAYRGPACGLGLGCRPAARESAGTGLEAWQSLPALADFAAQVSSAAAGSRGLAALARAMGGTEALGRGIRALDAYAERIARDALAIIPDGRYRAEDPAG
ncbi:MAG: hydantoinase B/oxoprolinase family protein [Gammaproteobacteria bacterium]|nr:hydantoinase B/oxoprolinase family protein [Gammaproteobacteria bacterium]